MADSRLDIAVRSLRYLECPLYSYPRHKSPLKPHKTGRFSSTDPSAVLTEQMSIQIQNLCNCATPFLADVAGGLACHLRVASGRDQHRKCLQRY